MGHLYSTFWSNLSKNFSFGVLYPYCCTFSPLLGAKCHPHRCNVSPLRGEKPQNLPLSNLNTAACNAGGKNSPSGHHRKTLLGYIFATKAHMTMGKKLLNSNASCTCPHNMANFGPLTVEIGSAVCGTPANFNGFRVLVALLHGTCMLAIN